MRTSQKVKNSLQAHPVRQSKVSWLRAGVQICTDLYIFLKGCPKSVTLINTSSCLSADIVSTVEFNHDGELLATGDKGGRIVIFQKEEVVSFESSTVSDRFHDVLICCP